MGVKISINQLGIYKKVNDAWNSGLPALSEEILEDCNKYAKRADGYLIDSSNIHSKPQKGLLVWKTPYALRQYWEIKTAHKDKNPKATWMWCEQAKIDKFPDWQRKAQKEFTDNL